MAIASILIPVFNREKLVQRAIQSALAQTLRDIEVIVVDNASTDSTWEVVQELARVDGRIRAYRNDANLGPVRNWQKCVEYARAPFSKILFSDDLISASYLERTVPALFDPSCALAYAPCTVGHEEWQGSTFYRAFGNDCNFVRDSFVRAATLMEHFTPVSPGAAIFRTDDLRKNILTSLPNVSGYDFSATGAGVDWLIYLLTALAYPYVKYVCDALVFFRAHEGSISVGSKTRDSVPEGYVLAKKWLRDNVGGL
jgi:glycosyltransferase involved in cell wall biosynthesis